MLMTFLFFVAYFILSNFLTNFENKNTINSIRIKTSKKFFYESVSIKRRHLPDCQVILIHTEKKSIKFSSNRNALHDLSTLSTGYFIRVLQPRYRGCFKTEILYFVIPLNSNSLDTEAFMKIDILVAMKK